MRQKITQFYFLNDLLLKVRLINTSINFQVQYVRIVSIYIRKIFHVHVFVFSFQEHFDKVMILSISS